MSSLDINYARRFFLKATGSAFGLFLTGCGGSSGGDADSGAFIEETNTFPLESEPGDETSTVPPQNESIDETSIVPPEVNLQPINQTVREGESAIFEVGANGTAPLTYQWQRNGIGIQGATEPMYITPPLTLQDDGGIYRVLVSNEAGSVQSTAAGLNVLTSEIIRVDSTFVTADALSIVI